ncbi:hypothetical protein IEO21_06185 [Rhodonia placenta]|uniref:Fe2OG dioxygenase domain-containing protein n=1 Tax=Rhodonia placenta TaxID=104341 RepID=A0A8H7P0H0_9APHY|nr:hypothetical protein IEO21_06185 [Postia placenta]
MPAGSPESKAAIGAHTDFGSLSFLHNRLGGLQVMVPGTQTWQYVKPLPGHAICNLGDAMSVFSGGILKSNLHRVVAPPKEQAKILRWSLNSSQGLETRLRYALSRMRARSSLRPWQRHQRGTSKREPLRENGSQGDARTRESRTGRAQRHGERAGEWSTNLTLLEIIRELQSGRVRTM